VPDRLTMPTEPRRWIWPGMMPILQASGVMTPGQFGPTSSDLEPASARFTFTMSSTGMPSVMQMISGISASIASRIASAAKGGIGNGGKPDVKNVACMKDCKKEVEIVSALPDYAQDAHGNLAEQNRPVGQTRGKQTGAPSEPAGDGKQSAAAATLALANEKGCMACHGVANKIIGPGYNEIAQKYQGQADAEAKLIAKVKNGGQGTWGAIPMPPQGHVADEDIKRLVEWILEGAKAQ